MRGANRMEKELLKEMTLEEKAQMCSGRDFWHTQDLERLNIPSVMMCDGPNGLRKQKGQGDHLGINVSIETVCYPTSSAMAASFDKELLRELGETLGEECQAEHVGMLLGPGINMKRSPLCGRNFEYFSEDPYLAGELASAYIQGVQSKGVAACVKHFAANNQETRRMSGSSQVDERTLHEIYLPAFEKAVKEGKTRSIMCAYNALNGVFCAENKELLTDILRKDWGFDGFVVTDWGASKSRAKGLEAGVDLEMPGSTEGKTEGIVRAVQNGTLDEADLDKAVRNILNFVKAAVENQQEEASFDRAAAHKKSADFAGECAVLLKNDGVLPLAKERKAAFIGAFAEKPRYQGAGSSHINVVHPVPALECTDGLQVTYAKGYEIKSEEVDRGLMEEAIEAAKEAEAAVIFAGLPESFEVEGCDRKHMRMPENQNILIHEIAKVQKNVIVVLQAGAPVQLPWLKEVSAVLCMYLGGDGVGKAAVELLYGVKNPSGKLAETWPVKLEDNPSYLNFGGKGYETNYQEGIFIGYRYYDKKKMEVQFPFGYGLSYTKFEYSDLKLEKETMEDTETMTVSCRIKNTGTCFGKEAVQLYVSEPDSIVSRPERELKGFQKVALMPGEEKEVTFTLDGRTFAYYEEKIHDWYTPSAAYRVEIGASSREIRLSGEVRVETKRKLPVHFTRYSTLGEMMQTERGRLFMEQVTSRMGAGDREGAKADDVSDLGEGAEQMLEATFDMPIFSMHSLGGFSEDDVDKLVAELNTEL